MIFFVCGFVSASMANNLILSSFDEVSTNVTGHLMTFTFNLKQENSWRNNVSHDAAWIFMKYSVDAGKTWHHASITSGGVSPAGFESYIPQDGKGFFFRRKDAGAGVIDVKGSTFVWNYGQDGLSDTTASAANTITRLFGLEMVYVPTGAFFAGDGASSSDYRFKKGSADDQPWYINSENAITTTNTSSGGFFYQGSGSSGENSTGDIFLLPNSFPKGYQAFYLMKFELTEGEWVAFFNTLSVAARINRDITSAVDGGKGTSDVTNRNTVSWDSIHPMVPAQTKRPARAMTYVSWPDAAAFADWAALRPMTELEYEKAARGVDIQPKADEFAWGSLAAHSAVSGDIFPSDQDENGAEVLLSGAANVNNNALSWISGDGRQPGGISIGQKGPLRAGIFSANSNSRAASGAGYYGNMEFSGNVAEPAVTIGRDQGRQFLGTQGDGELNILSGFEGNATNVDWPGIDSQDARRGITGTLGIGYRGGDYQSSSMKYLQISSRNFAAKDPDSEGFKRRFDSSAGIVYGIRCARSAQ
ncbi:MAG: SUMF1/EgtB/PvdO family nonheme iron enzyme [Candidatus Omnitrophica bacterium]|nr:SUMF1/EgtB/PvdO family nonheme iron enzyme [Candidatus Omnitrophota bacterium]